MGRDVYPPRHSSGVVRSTRRIETIPAVAHAPRTIGSGVVRSARRIETGPRRRCWSRRSAGSGVVRSARRIETRMLMAFRSDAALVRGLSDPLGGLKQLAVERDRIRVEVRGLSDPLGGLKPCSLAHVHAG